MSVLTLCIKYALGRVTVEDVTWVFSELFGEECVVKVSELVKQDRYSGKDFKIFFIECDQKKQAKGSPLDKLAMSITKNAKTGDKKGARVTIDEYGHYWQVTFAKEQPGLAVLKAPFKPSFVEEPEPTVEELTAAMEALQTKEELDHLYGRKSEFEKKYGRKEDNEFERMYGCVTASERSEQMQRESFEIAVKRAAAEMDKAKAKRDVEDGEITDPKRRFFSSEGLRVAYGEDKWLQLDGKGGSFVVNDEGVREQTGSSGVFELELAHDDPIVREALEEAAVKAWPRQP